MVTISKNRGGSSSKGLSITQVFLTLFLCCISYYTGTLSSSVDNCTSSNSDNRKIEELVVDEVKKGMDANVVANTSASRKGNYFPESVSKYMNGMTRIAKDEFVEKIDYGPPMDKGTSNNDDVMLFYNTPKAFPSAQKNKDRVKNGDGSDIALLDFETATENCDTMNVINTNNPGNTKQCLAIVGNYESYQVQRWMRVPLNGGKLDHSLPLRAVSRGYDHHGAQQFIPPDLGKIKKHWETLKNYFDGFESTLDDLKSVAEKVAVKNTIIVMTCNMGQSELLVNFVCNAHSKGFDLSNVLVFPTDQSTKELAEGLGLATFYDEKNMGDMPEEEAGHYGDRKFTAMMFAKVLCVQMINHLGYDLLFQDVDLVWYKNPLEYFHDPTNKFKDFDMYFQDDGAHSTRYAPLSANSGFYYVRNNARTRYLFTALLYAGDQILQSKSHQEALVQLMNEHTSLFGLRVKVLSRDMEEFPGGWHYHKRNKDFMMKLVKEESSPIIFHMSWTKNKDNKIKFLQQMGQWYVADACIAHTKSEILGNHDLDPHTELFEPCCLAEPNVICHYRDKPSKIPCRDSDPIDAGHPSFW